MQDRRNPKVIIKVGNVNLELKQNLIWISTYSTIQTVIVVNMKIADVKGNISY